MKTTRFNTREHLLTIGQTLCTQHGFNGMGLIELLKVAEVPKGSFYHYFPSKEAFGVAMLERYFAHYHQCLLNALNADKGDRRSCLVAYYRQSLDAWRYENNVAGCLSVKLSAEVCDLSEPMRLALDTGSKALVATLADALAQGEQEGSLKLKTSATALAQTIYTLWLGASLQSKIARESTALENALAHIECLLSGSH
ncbi:TetR/AcrR family transcriptional regulator [Erwinia sp. 9145]|uniref:TetR/AcrR family transcriptional regulator n=1 Tax=Erwinia sp. 9145 TaxID=1500895 RepID=UPI000556F9A3|nr:TetR/AcrR family transcriptional regulator [Erwinia sp. 9145]